MSVWSRGLVLLSLFKKKKKKKTFRTFKESQEEETSLTSFRSSASAPFECGPASASSSPIKTTQHHNRKKQRHIYHFELTHLSLQHSKQKSSATPIGQQGSTSSLSCKVLSGGSAGFLCVRTKTPLGVN